MALPRDILDCVERVLDFHEQTKLTEPARLPATDPSARPAPFRELPASAVVSLNKKLIDLPTPVIDLLSGGLSAVPESQLHPPQDMRTLSTWLHMATGYRPSPGRSDATPMMAYPTGTDLPPGDIYVAAFAIAGLEPGLYQFVPRAFALRRIRDGVTPLQVLRRGRPDLQFLSTVPAALLVSSIFSRTSSMLGRRGYRQSLLDCGYIVANLHVTAMALGINTMTRLRLTESNARELIGLTEETAYPFMEAVHALVVWAEGAQQSSGDSSKRPIHRPLRGGMLDPSTGTAAPKQSNPANFSASPSAQTSSQDRDAAGSPAETSIAPEIPTDQSTEAVISRALNTPGRQLPPIERPVVNAKIASFGSIVAAHLDSVARGVAIREIRPPLTDLSPLPGGVRRESFPFLYDVQHSHALRDVLLAPERPDSFAHQPIPRDSLVRLAQLAFRGGTFFPLKPAGQHLALVRPFFVVNDVTGMESGIWYYDPMADSWSHLNVGRYRNEMMRLTINRRAAGEAAAVCIIVANLRAVMQAAGPDLHRIAHLEAGVAGQRLNLVAQSMDLSAILFGTFFDNLCKQFLGLNDTPWEPLLLAGIGHAIHEIDDVL